MIHLALLDQQKIIKLINIQIVKSNKMSFENSATTSSSNPSVNPEKLSSDKSMEHKIKLAKSYFFVIFLFVSRIVGLAIFLRIFSAQYFTEFANQLPLFSTPWNSLKRFKEGVFLLDSGQPIYEGDLFHVVK